MSALEGRQRRAGDMSEQSMRGQFGIGEVLGQLRPEFPDISTSKIRFLEAEGLIEPARSRSGYRRFSAADIERLRYILTMQRDSYLPLRVIRERLAMKKVGKVGGEEANGVPPAGRANRGPADMTRRQLLDAAEISEAELTELEDYGLIRRVGRQYGGDALAVARALAALRQYGVQARHLRAVKAAADREANLVEQVVAPQLRQRGPGARDAAARTAWQIADLTLRLHATLVESALAEAGLPPAPLRAGDYEFEALGASGSSPTSDATEPAAGGLRSASGRLRVYLGKGSGGQTEVPQAREDGAVVRQMEVIGVRVEMPSNSPIVLLKEAQGDRYLPIWIGAVEATAIAFAQQGMVSLRPLTHDLFRDVLEVLHIQLRTVNITALRDGIFYADLVFSNGAEVSARPSDSIALALRTGAQIFASEEILDEAGVAIPDEQEDEVEKFREFLDTISPEDFGRAT
jgi:bifunctional DNase/RNase/DNA-binding transcriptional MerR regulator